MRYTYGKEPTAKEAASQGFFLNPQMVKQIADAYVSWKPLLSPLLKFGKVKIPAEVDEALRAIAGDKTLDTEEPEANDPNQMRVGEPVMTYQMAEEAYRMHLSGMGTRDIAEWFTKNGSPVSFQTVARWINDYAETSHAERNQRLTSIAKYVVLAGLWIVSMWVMKHYI
jgi:hypothetical protein